MKYNYKLVRSERRTISVTVSADNALTVRAPRGTGIDKIEKFLESKSGWIDKKIANNNRILEINSSVKSFKTVLVSGENVPFVIGFENGVKDGCVCIKRMPQLQNVMCDCFGGEFIERFNGIARANGFAVSSVKMRSYKARWGCCDAAGNIVFNYKILMLPQDLQDYVIIHELCHTKFMNHSSQFWREVKRFCPDYANAKKRLKDYAFLTRLYP